MLDGAPNHRCGDLALPNNISLLFLPPYAPELNPKENLWDEIREKIFKNYALKSIDAVRTKLKQAILYIERNPTLVKSITSFPYIAESHSDLEMVLVSFQARYSKPFQNCDFAEKPWSGYSEQANVCGSTKSRASALMSKPLRCIGSDSAQATPSIPRGPAE